MKKKAAQKTLEQRIKQLDEDARRRIQSHERVIGDKNNFGALLDLCPDPILILRKEQVLFINTRFTEAFGYSTEDLYQDESFYRLVQGKDKNELNQRLEERLARKKPIQFYRKEFIAKDGSLKPFETSARSITIENQQAVLITVRDITERRQIEQALKESHDTLEEKVKERTSELKEMNVALKVLLKKRAEDKKDIENQIVSNINSLVIPYLNRLAKSPMDYEQKTLLKILESNIAEIISPISHRLSSPSFGLTLTEIKVANLIKEGKKTKEIAGILNLSNRTIEKHRENIRKKLSLNRKENLQAYLVNIK